MAIPSYRLPPDIEQNAEFGPDFSTVIQEAVSGKEVRIRTWAKCRAKGDISYGIRSTDDLDKVRALFLAHLGRLYPFRFKDWSDYEATDEYFGTGDGTTTQFQLIKTYDPQQLLLGAPGSRTYVRTITLPVGTPTIMVNGVIDPSVSISAAGIVTFPAAPSASPASTLTWTGEFDLPVRFDTDHLPVSMRQEGFGQVRSIPIVEVIGES